MALLAASVACAAPTEPSASSTPKPTFAPGKVLVLGDSLTVGAQNQGGLETLLLDAGWEPEIVAESARTVAWALEQVEPRASVPRTVVVAMGSNPGPGLGTFPDEVDALLDALRRRGARRILWVPPHHLEADRYGERVAALLARENRRVDMVDWPGTLGAHPEWFQADGLHLTTEGYQGMAAFILDVLQG